METFNEKQIKMQRELDIMLAKIANTMERFAGDILLTREEIIDNLLSYGSIDCFCHATHFDTERRFGWYYGKYPSALECAIQTLGVDFVVGIKYDRESGRLTAAVTLVNEKRKSLVDDLVSRIRQQNVFVTTGKYEAKKD